MREIIAEVYRYLDRLARIAPGLVFVVALMGLSIAIRQSREASRSRRLAATKLLLDELGNDEVRAARSFVLEEMQPFTDPSILADGMNNEAIKMARRVGVAYDRIGLMVKQGLIDQRILFASQHVEIQQIWAKIEPVVRWIRSEFKRENYMYHFEYLATAWLDDMTRKI